MVFNQVISYLIWLRTTPFIPDSESRPVIDQATLDALAQALSSPALERRLSQLDTQRLERDFRQARADADRVREELNVRPELVSRPITG